MKFRVRLTGDRTWYVDVEAQSAEDAGRVALAQYGNAVSARCVGLTAELEARGRSQLRRIAVQQGKPLPEFDDE